MNRRTFLTALCSAGAALWTLLAEAAPLAEVTLKIAGMT